MPKLCQVIAIETGAKQRANKLGGEIHKAIQKSDLFLGRVKTYKPLDDDDPNTQPDEVVPIQVKVEYCIERFQEYMAELWKVVLSKDAGNQSAVADITVDGKVLAKNVPATTLVFLEKQLDDVQTFINALPVLSSSRIWNYDENRDLYESEPEVRTKTKKVMKSLVLHEGTDKHPPQTQAYNDDIVIGRYEERFQAAMLNSPAKQLLLDRIYDLKKAVRTAREEANTVEVEMRDLDALLKYIFE